jgi:hypothetical protein
MHRPEPFAPKVARILIPSTRQLLAAFRESSALSRARLGYGSESFTNDCFRFGNDFLYF